MELQAANDALKTGGGCREGADVMAVTPDYETEGISIGLKLSKYYLHVTYSVFFVHVLCF